MQELLHQMQRTASLLAERLANTSSSSASSSAYRSSFSVLSPPQPSTSLLSSSCLLPFLSLSPPSMLPSLLNATPSCVWNSTRHHHEPFTSSTRPSSQTNREDHVQANLAWLFWPHSVPLGGWKGCHAREKERYPGLIHLFASQSLMLFLWPLVGRLFFFKHVRYEGR